MAGLWALKGENKRNTCIAGWATCTDRTMDLFPLEKVTTVTKCVGQGTTEYVA